MTDRIEMILLDKEEVDTAAATPDVREPVAVEESVQWAARRPSKRMAAVIFAGLTAVFLLSIFYRPEEATDGRYFTICGFKNFTGLPCPGCGLTHSFCAIGKGDIITAFVYNILGPPLFLLLLSIWTRAVCVLAGRTRFALAFDKIVMRLRPMRVFLIAFVLFGVGRIIYLSIYQPSYFSGSPLAQLIEAFTR